MWVVFAVMCWFLVALLAPPAWALGRTWWQARTARHVTCPALAAPALVSLDPWYAARMHALGDQEIRIKGCTEWPGRQQCGRECMVQLDAARGA